MVTKHIKLENSKTLHVKVTSNNSSILTGTLPYGLYSLYTRSREHNTYKNMPPSSSFISVLNYIFTAYSYGNTSSQHLFMGTLKLVRQHPSQNIQFCIFLCVSFHFQMKHEKQNSVINNVAFIVNTKLETILHHSANP